jgi:hypothetical protein
LSELDNPPPDYPVHGRDMLTGIPKEIMVNYSEIAHSLDKSITKVEAAIINTLEITPLNCQLIFTILVFISPEVGHCSVVWPKGFIRKQN